MEEEAARSGGTAHDDMALTSSQYFPGVVGDIFGNRTSKWGSSSGCFVPLAASERFPERFLGKGAFTCIFSASLLRTCGIHIRFFLVVFVFGEISPSRLIFKLLQLGSE